MIVRALLVLVSLTGCKTIAVGALADALSGQGGALARDDDPELVAAAAPFGLKTMESVLDATPEHAGLLLALASGYTQYGYAFVEQPAELLEESSLDAAARQRARAKKLYARARSYAFRGLELEHPGLVAALRSDTKAALAQIEPEEVGLLYWAAASWGLSIGLSLDDPAQMADFPLVVALADRALELDESFGRGSIHELMITIEMSRPGGTEKAARAHFDRAIALSEGTRVGPYVTLAEKVTVKSQNAKEFKALLEKARAVPLDKSPNDRLANELFLRRAAWLLGKVDGLFLDPDGAETPSE